MDDIRMLRLAEVSARLGAGRSAIYARIQDGTLPKPVRIGARISGWPAHEINFVIQAHVAGKRESEIRELVAELHRQRAEVAA